MITLAIAAACGGAKNDSDSETGGDTSAEDSSGSDGGSGSHTGAAGPESASSGNSVTATEGADSGVEPTTTSVEPTTTSVEPTTSGVETTTSGDVTMTTGEDPTEGLCEEYCAHAIACMTETPAGCLTGCAAQLDEFAGECSGAALAWIACKASMTCDELVSLGEGDPGPCEGPLEELSSCADGCSAGGGGDVEGTACVWELECPLEPKLHMDCDAETCQCFEDGLPTGSCAAEGACLDIDTLADKMSACCGFPDLP